MFGKKNRKPLGLYIHIPFCKSKCDYCDFCSFVPNNKGVVEHYTDALILQMEDWSSRCRNYSVDSVYIGGGTPTYLDIRRIARIIDAAYSNFKIAKNAEFTIECNPATADYEYFKKLRRLGVNRLSIGCQSSHANELKALGRIHGFEQFKACFADAVAQFFVAAVDFRTDAHSIQRSLHFLRIIEIFIRYRQDFYLDRR